jgi:prephenate dehydratase
MSVAYQGVPGAFGHEACLAFLAGHEPVAKDSFAAVIEAVEAGETELGILPVENNRAGPVTEAEALIAASPLAVLSEHLLPVRMHLLGLPGARIEEIRTVASHPVALKQCARALAELGVETEDAPNTAVAAQMLSDPMRAVLASEAAAAAYGLSILRRDVHDRPDNATRFAVLAREDR